MEINFFNVLNVHVLKVRALNVVPSGAVGASNPFSVVVVEVSETFAA